MIRSLLIAVLCISFASGLSAQKSKNKPAKPPKPGKATGAAAAEPAPAQPAQAMGAYKLATYQDSVGYAIGVDIANNLKSQGIELSVDALAQAMKDVKAGTPALDQNQSRALLMKMQQDMRAKQDKEKAGKAAANLARSEKFMAENKTKPGVITLPSGLQYIVLNEGIGKAPSLSSSVTTHYHGTLIDGSVFDSSVERGQPATFQVGNVIQAWQDMLVLMKEGGKVRLFCPPNMAYGEQGSGQKIGPNEALIFEIELLKVN